MAFPENFINELVERSDIAEVVSGYVRLSKKSGSNMFGLCPFHSEKTPSFSVSPDKQIYHCFGCGKGGGVINFIMEVENLTFPEAVEFLAKRANMPMPEETEDRDSRKRARMLSLNRDAARFFYEQLSTPAGEAAKRYMSDRRISPATAKNFGIGCAPDAWDSLEKAMRQKGYTDFEMFDAGLVRKGKNGGYYDTFRSRLMFPVIDVRGNVIGFSGRILGDGEPKYMNSPETLVFNKSRNLFALNLAKKSKNGYIILSEGNIDVVSLHQAGFDSAVASLGTSLTPEQARLISRYANEVIIAYDSDGAGLKAAQRAIGILEKLDLKVKVLRMTGAKDPDEFIKLRGADAFRALLENSENQIDYRLRTIADKYNLEEKEQKIDFLREAYDLLARIPDKPVRQLYAEDVAALVDIKKEIIIAEVENTRRILLKKARTQESQSEIHPEKMVQPEEKGFKYSDTASARAEEVVIRALCIDPALASRTDLPKESEFSSPILAHIYSVILEHLNNGYDFNIAMIGEKLPSQELSLLSRILQTQEKLVLEKAEQALIDSIKVIRICKMNRNKEKDLRELAQKYRNEGKGYV